MEPPTDNVRATIAAAIQQGAPLYNRGDIKGCADLYRKTAEQVMQRASPADQQILREGLQKAGNASSSKDAAWALRHAFDAVLRINGMQGSVMEAQVSDNFM